jgi:hypothetical protein
MQSNWGSKPFTVACRICLFATAFLVQIAAAQNLVINGDFENGNTGFSTRYAFGDVSGPGTYNIGTNPSTAPDAYGDWCNCGDHTSGTGNMMIVNGANSVAWPVWEEVVHVTPSTEYTFSYWGAEVDHDSNSLPHIAVRINGKVIGNSFFPRNSPDNGGQWMNFTFTWNSGSSHTAELALVDLNTDTVFNDFAVDDISFAQASGSGGTASTGQDDPASGPIATVANIKVADGNGSVIALNSAEKVALMFMDAIEFMEGDCKLHLSRLCSLPELVSGVSSPDGSIGRLKYDPARDVNYSYTIAFAGSGWTASATPRRGGLAGFYVDGRHGMIADTYYQADGVATEGSSKLGDIAIDGELFHVH